MTVTVLISFKLFYCIYNCEKWRIAALKTTKLTKDLEKMTKEMSMYKLAWETKNEEYEKEKELIKLQQNNLWEKELYLRQKFFNENVKNINCFVEVNDDLNYQNTQLNNLNEKLNKIILQARNILSEKNTRCARRITELEKLFRILDNDSDSDNDEHEHNDSAEYDNDYYD
jgi:hypothetical protein